MKKTKIYTSTGTLPEYQLEGSSGVDLHANLKHFEIIKSLTSKLIPTGLHILLPEGYEAQVRSRSGLAAKNNVFVLNSPGTIDQNYIGEIKVILFNCSNEEFKVNPGDRIAQMILCPIEKFYFEKVNNIEELGTTQRGEGGFGSTGVQDAAKSLLNNLKV